MNKQVVGFILALVGIVVLVALPGIRVVSAALVGVGVSFLFSKGA